MLQPYSNTQNSLFTDQVIFLVLIKNNGRHFCSRLSEISPDYAGL